MPIDYSHYRIVTHPGTAHRDDFLSCCLVLGWQRKQHNQVCLPMIFRREPTRAELADATTFVLDIGGQYAPADNNFDHHFPEARPNACTLYLLLQDFKLLDQAQKVWIWFDFMNLCDCVGPRKACEQTATDYNSLFPFGSVIDHALLKLFGDSKEIQPADPLHSIMLLIGLHMLKELESTEEIDQECREHCEFTSYNNPLDGIRDCGIFWYTGTRAEFNLEAFKRVSDQYALAYQVKFTVTPNQRGPGLALFRCDGAETEYDLTQCRGLAGVDFVHNSGFFATTLQESANQVFRMIEAAAIKKVKVGK